MPKLGKLPFPLQSNLSCHFAPLAAGAWSLQNPVLCEVSGLLSAIFLPRNSMAAEAASLYRHTKLADSLVEALGELIDSDKIQPEMGLKVLDKVGPAGLVCFLLFREQLQHIGLTRLQRMQVRRRPCLLSETVCKGMLIGVKRFHADVLCALGRSIAQFDEVRPFCSWSPGARPRRLLLTQANRLE